MTTYRVGEAGATVFNEDGKPIARLRPGYVVVEGTQVTGDIYPKLPAEYHQEQAKRVGRYHDKKIRPSEDKGR